MGDRAPFLNVDRSFTGRAWVARAADERIAQALSQRFDLPDVVGRVMAARGIDLEQSESFLNPTLKTELPDPSAFRDMDTAADLIAAAICNKRKIVIFGDYDVDGATSTALLWRFLRAVGGDVSYYIPDRLLEGYGPNRPALDRLRQQGADLVITVDCGTVAFEPLEAATADGLEVVVVDHHLAEPRLPKVAAVVNPNRLDEAGGYGQLAAVGVCFILCIGINRALRTGSWFGDGNREPNLLELLDLVALGTVCDVVPLTGLNRAFVRQGIKILTRRQNVGLAALADAAGMQAPPTTYHLGFVLGPRVNAGGRIGTANLGARLLTTEDPEVATSLAADLNRLNEERREMEAAVLSEAVEQAERLMSSQGEIPVLVVAGAGWHAGVIGIVASRLKDLYQRPALVIGLDGATGKGSGRSIPGVDLGAAITAARQSGLLVEGGGHAMAAGVTVDVDRLGDFIGFLADRLGPAVVAARNVRELGFDGAVAVAGANFELLDWLQKAGPYGPGNPEPRFALPMVRVLRADPVGNGHLRCLLASPDGEKLSGMAFRCMDGPLGPGLLRARGDVVHCGGHLRANHWQGQNLLQFVIEDAAYPLSA